MSHRIEAALGEAFDERTVAEVTPAGPSWNDLNETVCVEFADGGSVFLKVAVDGDSSRIERELAVIDYVGKHCAVSVPSVLASRVAGDPPYLVTAPMNEADLTAQWDALDDEAQAAVLRQIGAGLADIHARTFDRHGHVVGGDADELALDTGPWSTVLAERVDRMRAVASSDRFLGYFDDVGEMVEANRDRLDAAPATLVHGDPAVPNLFREADSLGVVDWELAHVGDPARELHRARDQLLAAAEEATPLHEAYRSRAGALPDGLADRTPIYDAVRFLGTAGFFDKVAATSAESAEDVAAWIESEMDDRLAAVR